MKEFKFRLSQEIQQECIFEGIDWQANVIHEVKDDCKNKDYCHVIFVDNEGLQNKVVYKKSDVEEFLRVDDWIQVDE